LPAKRLPKSPQALIALSLDDIAVSLNQLIKLETENQKLLSNSYTLLADILTELRENQDEGGYLPFNGTVLTTEPTFIDTITSPEHKVKGFEFKNDGPNSVYVGFNVTKAGIQPVVEDVISNLSRYNEIKSGEPLRFVFNQRKIENIAFLAIGGSSTYRGWIVW
jgi:hypothetical protein